MKLRFVLIAVASLLIGLVGGAEFMLSVVRAIRPGSPPVDIKKVVDSEIQIALENDSYNIPRAIQRRTTEATLKFAEEHLKTVDHLNDRVDHLIFAMGKVDPELARNGLYCEFGVAGGPPSTSSPTTRPRKSRLRFVRGTSRVVGHVRPRVLQTRWLTVRPSVRT
jgi:hypothetical protein